VCERELGVPVQSILSRRNRDGRLADVVLEVVEHEQRQAASAIALVLRIVEVDAAVREHVCQVLGREGYAHALRSAWQDLDRVPIEFGARSRLRWWHRLGGAALGRRLRLLRPGLLLLLLQIERKLVRIAQLLARRKAVWVELKIPVKKLCTQS
jgi:hypothetical protein